MEIPRTIRILICDDDKAVRTLLKDTLESLDFLNVIDTEDVESAKAILHQYVKENIPIDLIISDWIMPGESGISFLQWVRNFATFKKLPFILLTSQQQSDQVIEGISMGASSYIIKPVTKKNLLHKMQTAWDKYSA